MILLCIKSYNFVATTVSINYVEASVVRIFNEKIRV
jgi:hypothetical protein